MSPYRAVGRGVKYGVLFVALTLVSILRIELLTGMRFHFVQYGVVGIGLVLFYVVLLSLAEHVGFTTGYSIAALVLTAMIVSYAYAMTGSSRLAATATVALATLYSILYVLLRLESHALLVGRRRTARDARNAHVGNPESARRRQGSRVGPGLNSGQQGRHQRHRIVLPLGLAPATSHRAIGGRSSPPPLCPAPAFSVAKKLR